MKHALSVNCPDREYSAYNRQTRGTDELGLLSVVSGTDGSLIITLQFIS